MNLKSRQLGKYDIVERLGRGGMAEVFKGFQPSIERFVAIKIMHKHLAVEDQFIERFRSEAKGIAQLRHHNIVRIIDFDVEDDLYYMVLDYIEGQTLRTYLKKNGLLQPCQALYLIAQLADALTYAHGQGIIHRDIKPGNIMFMDDSLSSPVLTDFGLARILGDDGMTVTGTMIGTPAYMSPEALRGEKIDARGDIYSLGVVLYEMVVGRTPYMADSPYGMILKQLHDPLPAPRSVNPDLPEVVEQLILKAMAKELPERFQNAEELCEGIQEAFAVLTEDQNLSFSLSRRLPPRLPLPKRRKAKAKYASRRRFLSLSGAVGGSVIVAFLMVQLLLGGGDRRRKARNTSLLAKPTIESVVTAPAYQATTSIALAHLTGTTLPAAEVPPTIAATLSPPVINSRFVSSRPSRQRETAAPAGDDMPTEEAVPTAIAAQAAATVIPAQAVPATAIATQIKQEVVAAIPTEVSEEVALAPTEVPQAPAATPTEVAQQVAAAVATEVVQQVAAAVPTEVPPQLAVAVLAGYDTPTEVPQLPVATPTEVPQAPATAIPTLAPATAIPTYPPQEVIAAQSTQSQQSSASVAPTEAPAATAIPTEVPPATAIPTQVPPATAIPTQVPAATAIPTQVPAATAIPTEMPPATAIPTEVPPATAIPTEVPPATAIPTEAPSPTAQPTQAPKPTQVPPQPREEPNPPTPTSENTEPVDDNSDQAQTPPHHGDDKGDHKDDKGDHGDDKGDNGQKDERDDKGDGGQNDGGDDKGDNDGGNSGDNGGNDGQDDKKDEDQGKDEDKGGDEDKKDEDKKDEDKGKDEDKKDEDKGKDEDKKDEDKGKDEDKDDDK